MSYYLIEDTTLVSIGDAIREKTGRTDAMLPSEMATAIRSISSTGGGSTEETPLNFLSQQVHVDTTTQGGFVTLLSGNSFISENYNNTNLFIALMPKELDEVDANTYSMSYQWMTMFAGNKTMTMNAEDTWYGMGIYLMLGKGSAFPSTLEIPYPLNDTSNTNYSYLNATAEGNIRVYVCNYDVLASGDYFLIAGLLPS